MKIPFFDLHRLYVEQKPEIDAAIGVALGSGHYILGKIGARFEGALAKELGASGEAIGCNSGTDALGLSLRAAGIGSGDEVVTVSHTAIPTITAVATTGARPVFVDIDPESWLVDPAMALRGVTPRTRAVIAVHLYGAVAPVSTIIDGLASIGRPEVAVIEDVAQAHGALLGGRQVGTLGRFGAFSFYPTKNIGALGDGGAVFCTSPADAERVRWLRNYGQKDRYHAEVKGGLNSRLDELQAAVLEVRLGRLAQFNARKAAMVQRYRTELAGLPLTFQKTASGTNPAWHLFVVACESHQVRERLVEHCATGGIQTLIHYPHPTHTQAAFRDFAAGPLPITESLASRIISLPMNPCLRSDEQERVIAVVRAFYGK
jgi:dTDP-3-amino-3,4,6-trideoxy-alpha-D-glucose transaminase